MLCPSAPHAGLHAPCLALLPSPHYHALTYFSHTRAHVAGTALARAHVRKAIEGTVTGTGAAYYKNLLLGQNAQDLVDQDRFYRSLTKRAPRDFIISAIIALQEKLRGSSSSGGSSGGGSSVIGGSGSSGGK